MPQTQAIESLYRSYVVDADGRKVGSIGQVYVDDSTNEPTWITVNTGFLGLKENFIPLEGSSTLDGVISVPFSKDYVKKAPAIEPEQQLTAEQEEELYRYYRRDKAPLRPARLESPAADKTAHEGPEQN